MVIKNFRYNLAKYPGLDFKFSRPTLFSLKPPVEVEIYGYDLEKLKEVSLKISREMNKLRRFTDIKSTIEAGHPEIQIHFDRERAAALGLAVHRIAERVVSKVKGTVASQYA